MADSALQWFQQIAIANPLKNMLTGTNLPTITDLFTGKTASPLSSTTTGSMTVTAGSVIINGGIAGAPGTLASALGLGTPSASSTTVAGTGINASATVAPANDNLAGILANSGATKTGIPLSTISGPGGLSADVNSQYAGNFQGFVNELKASGYQINSLGGYNYRNIAGTDTLSNHAFGKAIDINPATNPDTGRGGALVTDMPPNVSEMASKYGLNWGGDWNSKKDAMHFEVAKGAQPMQTQAINDNIAKLGDTASQASRSVDTLSTGAIDTSKALTNGNGSLLGAITKTADAAPENTGAAIPTAGGSGGNIFGSLFSTITSTLSSALKGIGSFIGNIFSTLLGGLFADGAAFAGGSVIPFASGGIVSSRPRSACRAVVGASWAKPVRRRSCLCSVAQVASLALRP
jgi:hypothetical protein